MDGTAGTIAAGVGLFAGTNVDDAVVLAVLFLAGRTGGAPRPWQVWAGQYAGFAVLVVVSVAVALGLRLVPDGWVGVLGLIPFALGVRGLLAAVRARGADTPPPAAPATGVWSVALLTVVNGADNLSIYPPVLRTVGIGAAVVTVVVFFIGVAVWCLAGWWLSTRGEVVAVIERWGHWIVPAVFVVLGVVILVGSGVLGKIL